MMDNREWTVIEALNWASSFLNKKDNAAELLLTHHLDCDRTHLLMQLREPLPYHVLQSFQRDIQLHKDHVPVQHLIGRERFYGRLFSVNEAVLIPRPETEELVLHVLKKMKERFSEYTKVQACDIGTGSGAIAVTLALEEERLEITAVDISGEALEVARENAEHLRADVCFIRGDLLDPIINKQKKFDIVVSNPPYIETDTLKTLDPNVRDYEPHLALDGGIDGMNYYRRIVYTLPAVLNDQAIIAFEVGAGQAKEVSELIREEFPQAILTIEYDINKKDRIVLAEIGF